MKPKDLTFFVVLLAVCGGIFFGGGQLGLSKQTSLIIAGSVLLLGVIIWLVLKLLALRRAAKIEQGMKDQSGPGAASGGGGGQADDDAKTPGRGFYRFHLADDVIQDALLAHAGQRHLHALLHADGVSARPDGFGWTVDEIGGAYAVHACILSTTEHFQFICNEAATLPIHMDIRSLHPA